MTNDEKIKLIKRHADLLDDLVPIINKLKETLEIFDNKTSATTFNVDFMSGEKRHTMELWVNNDDQYEMILEKFLIDSLNHFMDKTNATIDKLGETVKEIKNAP